MSLIEEYTEEFKFLDRYLLIELRDLSFISGTIFGSFTYKNCFVPGVSDIDICLFTESFYTSSVENITRTVKKTNKNFLNKEPYYLDDNIGKRVEFYIKTGRVVFDINLFPPEIPGLSKIRTNACRDGIDTLIPGIYERGILLFGELPQRDTVNNILIPFYDDDIRRFRLNDLGERLSNLSLEVRDMIKAKSREIVDSIYCLRSYFFKWLFIFKRKYPLSPFKHIEHQLKQILLLSDNEVDVIMLCGSNGIWEVSNRFLELCDSYREKYNNEINENEA